MVRRELFGTRPWVYDDGGLTQDVFATIPAVEVLPVVFAYDEAEGMIGVCFAQGLQCVVGIGGARQMKLEVAGLQHGVRSYSKLHHSQAVLLVE